jgi:DNA-binding HxlR family transcriptional regulator
MEKYSLALCPVRKSLVLLGGKWKLLLLDTFRDQAMRRYGELRQAVPDISEKMLIQELKHLVQMGFLRRQAYPEIPPRVEYTITPKGQAAFPIIDALKAFGQTYS